MSLCTKKYGLQFSENTYVFHIFYQFIAVATVSVDAQVFI